MKSLRGALFLAAAVVAVLVPLYGDPRQQPVTHPEWARMLLRALDMEAVLIPGSNASLAFDSLSWRTSLGLPTDHPIRSLGVELLSGPPRLARANGSSPGEVAYRVAAPRPGDYRLRVRLSGQWEGPLPVEVSREGGSGTAKTLSLVSALGSGGVSTSAFFDSGGVYLSPGIYVVSLALPPGVTLENLEVVPPCVNSIEPFDGWQPAATAMTGDLAVTMLKALDLESELPAAASPIELPSLAFQPTSTGQALRVSLKGQSEGLWLHADASGVQGVAHFTIDDPGLHTIYAFSLAGGGMAWAADACHKSVVCPTKETPEAPGWRPVLTAQFSAGLHSLALTLAEGAAIQRLRIERKKESVADYLAALARLGLDLGEQKPATRSQAADAVKLIKDKLRTESSHCEDVVLPAQPALVAGLRTPSGTTAFPPPGVGTPPLGPPLVPLQSSPSPSAPPPTTTAPPPPTTQPPSPPPITQPPPPTTLGPPPTTAPQPPATPVKE